MKFLLDTHLLLWVAADSPRLPDALRALLNDTQNAFAFSAASIWEVVIKHGLGRSDFVADPLRLRRGLLNNDYNELPITSEHALAIASLPPLHRDPFDRVLVAQARIEGIPLLTVDSTLAAYGAPVRLL